VEKKTSIPTHVHPKCAAAVSILYILKIGCIIMLKSIDNYILGITIDVSSCTVCSRSAKKECGGSRNVVISYDDKLVENLRL